MKLTRRVRVSLACLLMLIMIIIVIMVQPDSATRESLSPHMSAGVWYWEFTKQDTSPLSSRELRSIGIREVYADISEYIDLYESRDSAKISELTKRIMSYSDELRRNDIKLFLAAGNNSWSSAERRYIPRVILEYAKQIHAQSPETIAGVYFDIEPWTQASYRTGSAENWQNYLKTIESITETTVSSSNFTQRIGFSIPFWLDNSKYSLAFKGRDDTVYGHLRTILDKYPHSELAIMAYRTNLDGEDGVYALVDDELHADSKVSYQPHIRITQETLDIQPAKQTYYHSDYMTLVDNLYQIHDRYYSHSKLYSGLAINDMKGLERLYTSSLAK